MEQPTAQSSAPEAAEPAPPAQRQAVSASKKKEKRAQKEEPKRKSKPEDDGYYGSFGRSTDESNTASDQMQRHGDDGYYHDIKPAINLPVEPEPPKWTPPPAVRQVVPPRHHDPNEQKYDDDPGHAGSITFTRHEKQAKELLASGHYDLAKRHFKECLRLKEDEVNLYPGYWESCMKTNDWSESVRALEKMFQLDPSKEKDYCWAHGVALYHLRKYDQAVPVLRKSLAFGKHLDEVHLCLLHIAQQQKNNNDVMAEYTALLKLKPQDYNTQIEFANLLEATGHHSEAINHYKAAVSISPTDGSMISRLAYMLMFYNKDYDGAIGYYKRAMEADPRNAQTYGHSIEYAEQQKRKH